MTIKAPLRLYDSDGGQTFSLIEFKPHQYNYLAYQAGVGIASRANVPAESVGLIVLDSANAATKVDNRLLVGSLINTYHDQPVATHPGTSITQSSVTTYLYHVSGNADSASGFNRCVVWDSATFGVSQMTDSDGSVFARELASTIYNNEYPGSFRISSSSPGVDWSVYDAAVFTDTRVDGTSVAFNLYQRTAFTPGAPTPQEAPMKIVNTKDLREMSDTDIAVYFGRKVLEQSVVGSQDFQVGRHVVLPHTQTPASQGLTGTWSARGTATDQRVQVADADIRRTYSTDYVSEYTSNYTGDFIGNYTSFVGYTGAAYETGYEGANYTAEYTGNYTNFVNYTAEYLQTYLTAYTSTYAGGDYEANYEANYAIDYTRATNVEYTGADYVANYTNTYLGEYSRIGGNYTRLDTSYQRLTNYSRDTTTTYTGNVAVSYTSIGTATYVGDTTVSYTGGTFVGNYARNNTYTHFFQGDFIANYTGDFTGNFTRQIPGTFTRDVTATYTGNPSYVGTGQRVYLGLEEVPFTGLGFVAYLANIQYVANTIVTYTGVTYTGNYTRNNLVTYILDPGFTRLTSVGYVSESTFAGDYVGNFARVVQSNFQSEFTGNYTGVITPGYVLNVVTNYVLNTPYTSNLTYTGDLQYVGDFTRTNTEIFTANYLTTYTGNYTAEYLTGYTGATYQGADYSSEYTNQYTTSYERAYTLQVTYTSVTTANYTPTYLTNYVANYEVADPYIATYTSVYTGADYLTGYGFDYIGNFLALTIGGPAAYTGGALTYDNITTYTLYVKTSV